jgi:triacylglycerol lipase
MTRPTVVLLHGLARSARSLSPLRRHLEAAGFPTWSRTYPSRKMSVAAAAATVAEWIEADLPRVERAAVTHSLGGILVRHMPIRWDKIVMLAPPNGGSRLAASFADRPLFRWFYGAAGQELAAPSGPWPTPAAPFAVIAGTAAGTLGNPASWVTSTMGTFSGEPNDGTLSVAETRHPSMTAFATVPASHTWIFRHPETLRLVVTFLETGSFSQ